LPALGLILLGALAGAGMLHWLGQDPLPPPAAPPAAPAPAAPATPAAASPAPAADAKPAEPAAAPAPAPAAEAPKPPAAPELAPEQLRRLAAYSAGGAKLLRERLAATLEKLRTEPDQGYSVELFVADNSDPARTERFLLRARELVPLEEMYVIPVATGSRYHLRVIYGAYPDRETALEAARRLPPKYQKAFDLEARSWAELRAAI
jgi:hypothetical protein